jgi:hypothetical protein
MLTVTAVLSPCLGFIPCSGKPVGSLSAVRVAAVIVQRGSVERGRTVELYGTHTAPASGGFEWAEERIGLFEREVASPEVWGL